MKHCYSLIPMFHVSTFYTVMYTEILMTRTLTPRLSVSVYPISWCIQYHGSNLQTWSSKTKRQEGQAYCTISTLGSHDFHVTMVTRRFTCSPVDLTCDKPISCSQMTLNRKFYIKLGVVESQNRFADSDFVWPSHQISSVYRALGQVTNLRSK